METTPRKTRTRKVPAGRPRAVRIPVHLDDWVMQQAQTDGSTYTDVVVEALAVGRALVRIRDHITDSMRRNQPLYPNGRQFMDAMAATGTSAVAWMGTSLYLEHQAHEAAFDVLQRWLATPEGDREAFLQQGVFRTEYYYPPYVTDDEPPTDPAQPQDVTDFK